MLYYILLILTTSGYVPGGSDTTIHNTIHKKQKKHKITHTHSKQYTTQNIRNNNNIQRDSPTIPSDLVPKQLRIVEIN